LQEPSVVAVSLDENRILAVGQEAKEMIGRTPDTIRVYRPLKDGVIADFRVTQAMIRYFINKTRGPFQFLKPELMIAVPAGITSTERRAVIEAATNAGAKETFVAKEPILAAIGAGIPINACSGNLIVDIGGGTAEVAVISLGGIVANTSVRIGGNKFDAAIQEYTRKKHSVAIGERSAEELKIQIGSALILEEKLNMDVKGRDMVSGLPTTLRMTSDDVTAAIQNELMGIIQAVKSVLQNTPPELSADVIDKGMVLSGGSALLRNMDKLLSQETGVPAYVADEALLCVAKGTGVALDNLDSYKCSILSAT